MPTNPLPPITVRSYGAGRPAIVLLHGGPGAPGQMEPVARELADEFHLLEPLQRQSGAVPLTVARHVEDLAAVVTEPAVVVGSSWGAMLGLSFAATHPGQAIELVLVGCGTYDSASRERYVHEMDRRLAAEDQSRFESLRADLAGAQTRAEENRIFSELGAMSLRAQSHDPTGSGPQLVEGDYQGYLQTWTDALELQTEGIEPARFAAISCPVWMLHGAEDPHPGPSTRDTLRAVLPQLEYRELDRCGHIPWRERHAREIFFDLLRRRLRRATESSNSGA